MSRPGRALVLSDFHIAAPAPGASFRDGVALAALLDHVGEEPGAPPTELVLAGDIFDFLWCAGYEGFDAARAPERFEAILANPAAKEVLAAVARFAARPGNEVTLLSGNHDPELLLPEVRSLFERAIGRPGTVLHADDEPLRPAEGDRPAVFGRALGPAEDPVWIVHGDYWDPVNRIDREQVCSVAAAGGTIELPAGSHLVFKVLRQLKPRFSWIDQLKPEIPAVLVLLLYLDPAVAEGFLARHYGLTSGLLRDMVRARLRLGPRFGEKPAIPAAAKPDDALVRLLAASLAAEPPGRREALLAELQRRMAGGSPAGAGTLADHRGLLRWLARALLLEAGERDRFLDLDGPDSIPDAATPVLPESLAALVVGHTHAPRSLRLRKPAYFNTGTWLPVARLPTGDLEGWIDRIEREPPVATVPRTLAWIDLGDGSARVRLLACDEHGAMVETGG